MINHDYFRELTRKKCKRRTVLMQNQNFVNNIPTVLLPMNIYYFDIAFITSCLPIILLYIDTHDNEEGQHNVWKTPNGPHHYCCGLPLIPNIFCFNEYSSWNLSL